MGSKIEKEYIIINKTAIQKRIEDLEIKIVPNPNNDSEIDSYNLLFIAKQNELNKILSQSTPLIPEIEKAFDTGKAVGIISYQPTGHTLDKELYNERKQDYISNLKLDI